MRVFAAAAAAALTDVRASGAKQPAAAAAAAALHHLSSSCWWRSTSSPCAGSGMHSAAAAAAKDEGARRMGTAPQRFAHGASLKLQTENGKALNEKDAVRTVYTAIAANAAISLFKGGSWMMTGSSSLFAEAIHSCVDTINQGMLAVGIERSKREPDAVYNYGYQRERYVWGLISNVATLCGGAGVTIVHGLHSIWHPGTIEYIWLGLATMFISALGEGYSLHLAANTLRNGAKLRSITFWEYLRSGQDPTTTAVFMEDGIAVGGLAVATGAMIATLVTGEAVYDAYGSLFVGCVMGSAALWLIQKNRSYLLGRAMAAKDLERAQLILLQDPAVTRVFDIKSEGVGPDRYRFKVEVELNGRRLVRENLHAPHSSILRDIRKLIARGRAGNNEVDDGEVARVLELYGRDIVRAIGSRIDDLEGRLVQNNPSIHHVDIEIAGIKKSKE